MLCARPFTFLCPTSGCFPPSFPWKRLALLIASSNCHGVCALSSLFVSWTFYRLFFLLLGHGLQWVFSETFSCFSMCKYIEVHYEGNHMFCFCKWNCANKCFKTDSDAWTHRSGVLSPFCFLHAYCYGTDLEINTVELV